ncbi:MAG: hypothetical protein QXX94_03625 [Candidatus Bathyarchaeia archaeon]
MSDHKINIFYLISFLCTVILIIYVGLIFFPQVADYISNPEMKSVIIIVAVIIALLIIAAGLQLFLLIKPTKY